jgi:hypothetical protein
LCLPASPLPLASRCCFIPFMDEPRFFDRGLAPHQFTPMLGVHHAVERTASQPTGSLGEGGVRGGWLAVAHFLCWDKERS